MIQVSKRLPDGSIKYCRVHDVVRDLAIQKAKEINFLMVCSNPYDWKSCSNARRVAIHYSDVNNPMDNYGSPNVRSLLFFGNSSKMGCSKYRVLRVLGYMKGRVVWPSFRGSPQMRYLQMRTSFMGREREFGKWVRGMKYLETLDLQESYHGEIYNWIWQVKTLRHVLLKKDSIETQGPPASVDLSYLQTLRNVRWNELWKPSSFPNIPRVRELDIAIDGKIAPREVASLLGGLKHVVDVCIRGVVDFQKIATEGCPFNENLKILHIYNSVDHSCDISPLVLGDDMLPHHLTDLFLGTFDFGSDFMPALEKLGSLKCLVISGPMNKEKKPVIRKIRCTTGGFKQLEELALQFLRLEEWKIEMGAMPMLKQLSLLCCDPLTVPPELIHLHTLQDLDWNTEIKTNMDTLSNIFEQRPHLRGLRYS